MSAAEPIPMNLSADVREQLAEQVEGDSELTTAERETTISFVQDSELIGAFTAIPSVARSLLRHDEADVMWIGGKYEDGERFRYLEGEIADETVDGYTVHSVKVKLPMGALKIKGTVRSVNRPSTVVSTPSDVKAARENFAEGDA